MGVVQRINYGNGAMLNRGTLGLGGVTTGIPNRRGVVGVDTGFNSLDSMQNSLTWGYNDVFGAPGGYYTASGSDIDPFRWGGSSSSGSSGSASGTSSGTSTSSTAVASSSLTFWIIAVIVVLVLLHLVRGK